MHFKAKYLRKPYCPIVNPNPDIVIASKNLATWSPFLRFQVSRRVTIISSIFPLLVLAVVCKNASGWCSSGECEAAQKIVTIEHPWKGTESYKGACIGPERDCILVTGGWTPAIVGKVIKRLIYQH